MEVSGNVRRLRTHFRAMSSDESSGAVAVPLLRQTESGTSMTSVQFSEKPDVSCSKEKADDGGFRLTFLQRYSFGVGHVMNDLCAAIWFSYVLVFLHRVMNIPNGQAGLLVLIGQIADAIATPTSGLLSDSTKSRYGKRKVWHLAGCILVAVSFPLILEDCFLCHSKPSLMKEWVYMVWYAFFIILFQFGWAAVQVSHLALVPELTPCDTERTGLNSIRYAFTVFANVAVFGIAWFLLGTQCPLERIGPKDAHAFRDLSFFAIGLGMIFVVIFHVGVKEVSDEERARLTAKYGRARSRSQLRVMTRWKDWFYRFDFYVVGLVYMCTRMIVNITQVYLSMYLLDSIIAPNTSIATVPLTLYGGSFVSSFALKRLSRSVSRRAVYVVGVIISIGAAMGYFALEVYAVVGTSDWQWIYPIAFVSGLGGSTILVTALSMVADIIGDDTSSSAFVYGSMSLLDKISNGVAIAVIQYMDSTGATFYRNVISIIPITAALVASLGCLAFWFREGGERERERERMSAEGINGSGEDVERVPLLHDGSAEREGEKEREEAGVGRYGAV